MAVKNDKYLFPVMIKTSRIEMNNEYWYWNFCHICICIRTCVCIFILIQICISICICTCICICIVANWMHLILVLEGQRAGSSWEWRQIKHLPLQFVQKYLFKKILVLANLAQISSLLIVWECFCSKTFEQIKHLLLQFLFKLVLLLVVWELFVCHSCEHSDVDFKTKVKVGKWRKWKCDNYCLKQPVNILSSANTNVKHFAFGCCKILSSGN